MSFLSSLTPLVEFLNEEKLLLKPVEHTNFIYAVIYSFLSKHEFKVRL